MIPSSQSSLDLPATQPNSFSIPPEQITFFFRYLFQPIFHASAAAVEAVAFFYLLPANPLKHEQQKRKTLKATFDMFDSATRAFYYFENAFAGSKNGE